MLISLSDPWPTLIQYMECRYRLQLTFDKYAYLTGLGLSIAGSRFTGPFRLKSVLRFQREVMQSLREPVRDLRVLFQKYTGEHNSFSLCERTHLTIDPRHFRAGLWDLWYGTGPSKVVWYHGLDWTVATIGFTC